MFITACNERGNSPPTVSKVRLYTKKSLLPKITRSYRGSSPSSSPLDPPLRWTTRLVVSYINKHKCINRLCKGTTPTWFSYHLIAVGYHSDAVISIGRLAIIHIQTSQGQLSCHLYQGRRKQIISGGHKFRREAPEIFWGAPNFSLASPPEFWGSNELAVVIGLSKAKYIYKHSHVGELVTVLYKRNKLDNYNKIYY